MAFLGRDVRVAVMQWSFRRIRTGPDNTSMRPAEKFLNGKTVEGTGLLPAIVFHGPCWVSNASVIGAFWSGMLGQMFGSARQM